MSRQNLVGFGSSVLQLENGGLHVWICAQCGFVNKGGDGLVVDPCGGCQADKPGSVSSRDGAESSVHWPHFLVGGLALIAGIVTAWLSIEYRNAGLVGASIFGALAFLVALILLIPIALLVWFAVMMVTARRKR